MTIAKRKEIRLKDYDYSQNGVYFITICTENRKNILGAIVGDGALDVPTIILSPCGKIVEENISRMDNIYSHISIDKHVIMQNHVHLLVAVQREQASGMSRAPSPTNAVIPAFVSTLKRFVNKQIGKSIWQRSYNDRIIRDYEEYLQKWQYIEENPLKWAEDEYYSQ